MLRGLSLLRRGLDRLLQLFTIVAMAVLVLSVLWGVFTRYVMGSQADWTQPMATAMIIWVSMLGGALAYGERGHLGVDYFVGKLEPAARRVTEFLANTLVLLFAAGVMVYGGFMLVFDTLRYGQIVPGLAVERGYLYLAVPISGVFIVIYAIEAMCRGRAEEPSTIDPSEQVHAN
jgi:TRAP-type C4-dicarboxylate transport system permease small subunit